MLILTIIAALLVFAPLLKACYHAFMAAKYISHLDKEIALNYLLLSVAMVLLVAMFASINYMVNTAKHV